MHVTNYHGLLCYDNAVWYMCADVSERHTACNFYPKPNLDNYTYLCGKVYYPNKKYYFL